VPPAAITEFSRGLKAGSSPVGVTAGRDGNVWFTDEGGTPAVGRITPWGQIREFSAGLDAGSEPALIAPAPDGALWFTDEGSSAALGKVDSGAAAAVKTPPLVVGSPRVGSPLSCRPGRWSTWAHVKPSIRRFAFDGYQWLRDGASITGQRTDHYIPVAADLGSRLSCQVTVTYPVPFLVSAPATSATITVR
jgi:streptogramin lyase